MAHHINPAAIWQPFGAFCLAVVEGEGRVVHLKGQVPLDRDARLVGRGDLRVQLRQTLENLRAVLEALGGGPADVISLVHYTTDIDGFMAAGDIRQGYFQAPYPVTTTVQVARLYDPEIMIEITAVAEIPLERLRTDGPAA